MDTKSSGLAAIPRLKGVKEIVWSNHAENVQETEISMLAWICGLLRELPGDVHLVYFSNEYMGICYMILDMSTYPNSLPNAPRRNASAFMPVYFSGDKNLATATIGAMPTNTRRIGTPYEEAERRWYVMLTLSQYNPTPFSCGVASDSPCRYSQQDHDRLVLWTSAVHGGACEELAVQHTLCYHAYKREYVMMIVHTVTERDNTLAMFQL